MDFFGVCEKQDSRLYGDCLVFDTDEHFVVREPGASFLRDSVVLPISFGGVEVGYRVNAETAAKEVPA